MEAGELAITHMIIVLEPQTNTTNRATDFSGSQTHKWDTKQNL